MRFFKVPLCLVLIFMLGGCAKSRFMDLSGFIFGYNELTSQKVTADSFIYREDTAEYKLIKENILITLREAPDGKICECRVMLLKLDENGGQSQSLQKDGETFYTEAINVIEAFCQYDRYTAEGLLGELTLGENADYLKEGELTVSRDKFHIVYYSTPLVCQIMIYDTYLAKIETTNKPDSPVPEEKSHPSETSGTVG